MPFSRREKYSVRAIKKYSVCGFYRLAQAHVKTLNLGRLTLFGS